MPTTAEKRRTFRDLHKSGCFLIPNPWDVGTTRYLQQMGFKALATTSAGFAFAMARPDGAVPRDMMLAHIKELSATADVPINADFEAGYADTPEGVAESVKMCVATGVSGLSIEDVIEHKLLPMEQALTRFRAARAAVDATGGDTLLVGRCDAFLAGVQDIDEAIKRLKAYSEAGADCLYAPGIRTREHIAAVVKAVAPKPVNLLVGFASDLTVADIAALGVRRISVGGALSRVAWTATIATAKKLLDDGRFDGFGGLVTHGDMGKLFAEDMKRRPE
jgi:2-methylisocitrate lyase-like PEP mutase family enzyme